MQPPDAYTPVWALTAAAAILSLCGSGYILVKFIGHILDKRLEYKKKLAEAAQLAKDQEKQDKNEEQRNAENEAWQVADRLRAELEGYEKKFGDLEEKFDQTRKECEGRERAAEARANRCESEHEGTKAVLEVVVAWGKQKGMRLPPEIEKRFTRTQSQQASDSHKPLQEGEGS